jgi:hypothetical protein
MPALFASSRKEKALHASAMFQSIVTPPFSALSSRHVLFTVSLTLLHHAMLRRCSDA